MSSKPENMTEVVWRLFVSIAELILLCMLIWFLWQFLEAKKACEDVAQSACGYVFVEVPTVGEEK